MNGHVDLLPAVRITSSVLYVVVDLLFRSGHDGKIARCEIPDDPATGLA
jgi:hypothetical protein